MALLMYLNKERFRPENPLVFDSHLNDDVMLSFVDLIPSVIKRSTTAAMTAGEVEYHSFREIMDLVNSWLERNPNWHVFNCETVMLYYKFNDKMSYYELKPNDSNFYIYGSEKNNVLKALRIWVKRKRVKDKQYIDVQTLNYYDLLPEQLNEFGKYENLDHMLKRANDLFANNEVQGQLITVESLICESSGLSWRVEPDVTLSAVSTKKMIVLRIFYQENSMLCDGGIGILDFVPRHLSGGGLFKRPKYEPFDEVLTRAYIWLSEHSDVRLINLKTLDVKLKSSGTDINTKIMHYHEHGCYIRILRLAFATSANPTPISLPTNNNETASNSTSTENDNSAMISIEEPRFCWLHRPSGASAGPTPLSDAANQLEVQIYPDDEKIPASEELAQEEAKRQQRLRNRCTCETDQPNSRQRRQSNHPLLLSSQYFSPLRRNETIQQMQQRIHEFVAGPPNSRQTGQRRAALHPSTSDGEISHPSTSSGCKGSTSQNQDSSLAENDEMGSSSHNEASAEDLACNVLCAETINIFCKSIETDLNAEQNETFQYNRFGTRGNGYIFVSFRVYFDFGSDEQILDYKSKERIAAESRASQAEIPTAPTGAAAAARKFRKAIRTLNAKLTGSTSTPLIRETV